MMTYLSRLWCKVKVLGTHVYYKREHVKILQLNMCPDCVVFIGKSPLVKYQHVTECKRVNDQVGECGFGMVDSCVKDVSRSS